MSKSMEILPSQLFKRGDLAVTVNSRAPILNNGHIVRIVEVLGPMPERDIEFGYGIERIDGQPFVLVIDKDTKIPVPGKKTGYRALVAAPTIGGELSFGRGARCLA
jgi:hypothetical protein